MPSFISGEEEALLAAALDGEFWSAELKRRVQHFGYRYDYRARMVTADAYLGPLPNFLRALSERLTDDGLFEQAPDQAIANEYLPGQGISAHVDCVPCFGESIASLSLLSACEMLFRHRTTGERCSIILEPRSMLHLRGPARYDWTHEIPGRSSDIVRGVKHMRQRRISLTFRRVLRG